MIHRSILSLLVVAGLSCCPPAWADSVDNPAEPPAKTPESETPQQEMQQAAPQRTILELNEYKAAERQLKSMDFAELSTLALWWPNYSLQASTARQREKHPDVVAVAQVKVENSSRNFRGEPAASELLGYWPEAAKSPYLPIAAWVVENKVAKIAPITLQKLPLAGDSMLLTMIPLNESEKAGYPIVLIWDQGQFMKISPSSHAGALAKAIRACVTNDKESLEKLLDSDLSANTKDDHGKLLSYYAAEAGSVRCLEALKAKGAELKTDSTKEPSPLGAACKNGREAAVNFLLASKVPNDGRSQSDQSPLYRAAANGHLGTVKLLLAQGANPDEVTNLNETAIVAAINNDYPEVAEALYKSTWSTTFNSEDKGRAFLTLCREGKTAMVRFFLDKGARASFTTENQSALTEAALRGSSELAGILIKAGANVNWADERGTTPLFIACSQGNVPFARALLEAGAKPSVQTKSGLSALHAAVLRQKPELVALLLKAGSSPDLKNSHGTTPFVLSLMTNDSACVEEFVKAGAKLDIKAPSFARDLESVVRMDQAGLLRQLLQQGLSADYPLPGKWPLIRLAGIFNATACSAALAETGAKLDDTVPCPIVKPSALEPGFKILQTAQAVDPRPMDMTFPAATVRVRFLVDQDGSTRFISVEDCPDSMLRISILDTVASWKFTAPVSQGKPAAVRVSQRLEFPSSKERKPPTPVIDEYPKPVKQVAPIMPFEAHRRGNMATVTVAFIVTEQGKVEKARVIKTSSEIYNRPALEAVRQWIFTPAKSKGVPVPMEMQIPLVFTIEQ